MQVHGLIKMFLSSISHYHSTTLGKVCLVPRPFVERVELDDDDRPERVLFHNPAFVYGKWFDTLKGLKHSDYDRIKPDIIIYQLGDGTLLSATADVCQRSDTATHNTKGGDCFEHRVSDLRVIEQLPPRLIDVLVLAL
jgi:hypothetical protein